MSPLQPAELQGCPSCQGGRITWGTPGTPGYVSGPLVSSWYPPEQGPNTWTVQYYVQDDVRGLVCLTYTWSWKAEDVPEPQPPAGDAEEGA